MTAAAGSIEKRPHVQKCMCRRFFSLRPPGLTSWTFMVNYKLLY
ncbi:hypothetical protein SELSPUOL_02495 [Selenomonas sputigena ATCC 35185]|uniref:Uncharacterized protein n=1 Tax=Selenomonas sputigena (strain ATCC 35185 / DSM 20758 / CCUG 44933 / VPI D19B-28) TaxID=546271 RepID=C9LYD5_SELS3|nr:hypothetical protein SELSPUOL_02495 [Selenomonas sputigena ATCC 35185]